MERMKDSKRKTSQDSDLDPGLAAGGKKSRKTATEVVDFLKEKANCEQTQRQPTSFPGSLFSASIVVEKRPWLRLVTCLPESGRFTKCVLGDGWQCRPCRHCEEGNQHAIDFVAR